MPSNSIYNISLAAVALSTGNVWDLLTIMADSSSRFELIKIHLQLASTQFTAFPGIGLQLMRGSTGVSTGAAITPVNIGGWSGALAASLTATQQTSTVLSTASAAVIYAGGFDANGTFKYEPRDKPVVAVAQRINLRTSTPQIAVSIYGSATLRELGKGLPT